MTNVSILLFCASLATTSSPQPVEALQSNPTFSEYIKLLSTPINAKTITIKGKTFRRVDDENDYFELESPAPKCELVDLGGQTWTIIIRMPGLLNRVQVSKKLGIEGATWERDANYSLINQNISYDAPGLPKGYRVKFETDEEEKETVVWIEKGSKTAKPAEPPFQLPNPRLVPEFQLGAKGSFEKSGNTYEFKVEKAGSEVYSAQIFWEYPPSCTGRKYRISFEIQALRAGQVEMVVVQGDIPFKNMGLKETISVNEDWKRVSYTVTVPTDSKVLRLPCLMVGLSVNSYSIRGFSVRVEN